MKESRIKKQDFIMSARKLLLVDDRHCDFWESGEGMGSLKSESEQQGFLVLALAFAGVFFLEKSLNLSEMHILAKEYLKTRQESMI